jgi:hypothetical protein
MDDLTQSWDEENQRKLDIEDKKYIQLCVWPATILGDYTPAQFELYMKEEFGVRVKFEEEVITEADSEGEGGRHDLFFYVHSDDIGKFAIPRMSVGIRWWEDVVANNSHKIYPKNIKHKYQKTW